MCAMISVRLDLASTLGGLQDRQYALRQGLRRAVFEGVRLLRREAEIQAPRSHAAHYFYGKNRQKYRFEPGSLRRSVYVAFVPELSVDGKIAMYAVSYRKQSSQLGYVPYAHMVHGGVKRASGAIAPNPFIGRAYSLVGRQVSDLVRREILECVRDGKNVG